MKLIIDYDSDCKACFDNLLYTMLELKNKKRINEFFYRPFNLVLVDSNLPKDELAKILNSDSPVEHKFSKFEELADPNYAEMKKGLLSYNKSLFDK